MVRWILVFLFGSCIGSFINVICIRKGWMCGRSRCDMCGHRLSWYELIPVLSFLLLGGRCRVCKGKIAPAHLVSEIICGVGAVIISNYMGFGKTTVIVAITVVFLSVCAICDLQHGEVSSLILYIGLVAIAIIKIYILLTIQPISQTMWDCGIGVLIYIVLTLIAIIFKEKIGGADTDVLFAMYLCGGVSGFAVSLVASSLIGCTFCFVCYLQKKWTRKTKLRLIPFLCIGFYIYLFI